MNMKTYKQYTRIYMCLIQKVSNTQNNTLSGLSYYRQQVRSFLISQKIRNKFGSPLIIHLLNDDDAMSYLMCDFMKADWKHREYIGGASKITLRYNAGLWFIYKYLKHHKKYRNQPILSLDYALNDDNFQSIVILDKNNIKRVSEVKGGRVDSPINDILEREKHHKTHELAQLSCLTKREQSIVKMYFLDGQTLKQTGEHHKLSKERTRQIVEASVKTIREHIDKNENLLEYWEEEIKKR